MPARAERPPDVARQAAHVEAPPADHLDAQHGPLVGQHADAVHVDGPHRDLHLLTAARELVGALPLDVHGTEARRGLLDVPHERLEHRGHVRLRGRLRHRDLLALALAVVGVGERAQVDLRVIDLRQAHDAFHAARGERIQAAGMAGLDPPGGLADPAHHVHGAPAHRLVHDEDAGHGGLAIAGPAQVLVSGLEGSQSIDPGRDVHESFICAHPGCR